MRLLAGSRHIRSPSAERRLPFTMRRRALVRVRLRLDECESRFKPLLLQRKCELRRRSASTLRPLADGSTPGDSQLRSRSRRRNGQRTAHPVAVDRGGNENILRKGAHEHGMPLARPHKRGHAWIELPFVNTVSGAVCVNHAKS